jgi:hypothetical protein
MGFFWVASYSMKRAFVKRPDPFPISGCSGFGAYSETEDMDDMLDCLYYILLRYPEDFTDPPYYITRKFGTQFNISQCQDCRIHGGDILKPDFWE